MICPKCNRQLDEDSRFCEFCGEKLEVPANAPATNSIGNSISTAKEKAKEIKNKMSKKTLMAGGAGVAVIAIALVLIMVLSSVGSAVNYAMYIKEGGVYSTGLPKANPWKVTEGTAMNGVSNESMSDYSWDLGNHITVSNDGKRLFYVENFYKDSYSYTYSFTLFFRFAADGSREPIRIASGVSEYSTSPDGKYVTYLTTGNDLYFYNFDKNIMIASDVKAYYSSDDQKTMLYLDAEGNLYLKSGNKDAEKLAKGITCVEHFSEDFTKIYYNKDGNIYMKDGKNDAKKILTDVSNVLSIYDSGEIYYVVSENKDATLWDYVKDDMKSDADAKEPVAPERAEYPEAPDYSDYDDYDDYKAARKEYWDIRDRIDDEYDEAYSEYKKANREYQEVEERNELREELKNYTVSSSVEHLHYFDGKKDSVVAENFNGWITCGFKNALVVYSVSDETEGGKLKLSEIDSTWDVTSYIDDNAPEKGASYIAIKSKAKEIKAENEVYGICLTEDETAFYYVDRVDTEKSTGDLFKITISDGKTSAPAVYAENVYCDVDSNSYYTYVHSPIRFVGDSIAYFKNVKDNKGELVIGKTVVDKNAYASDMYEFYEDGDTLYYFADWDEENSCGTLRKYDGKKASSVYEKVANFTITPGGDVLMLTGFSTERYTGDLYVYTGKKTQKVDEDVSCILRYFCED